MSVANTKSALITSLDATPRAPNSVLVSAGRLREDVAKVEVDSGDDDDSIYRMFRVRSADRVSEIQIFNDAIAGGTGFDLGLYDTAERGGAVVAIGTANAGQLWGSGISMASARATSGPLNAVAEALNIDDLAKPIWQLLQLSADPGREYDVAFKATTVGTTTGGIACIMRRVMGD